MRLFVSVIATAIFFAASAASAAVTFTVAETTGADLNALVAGQQITLDITMRSDELTFAVGAAISSTTVGDVTLVSGTTSSAAFVQFATGPGTGFGGLDSAQAVAFDAGVGDIQFFNGVSIGGTPATGTGDISPVSGVAGGPHAQVTLTVNASTNLTIGALAAFGDAVVGSGGAFLTANNAELALTVIPEPGTALLMGLGLAGLAGAGRRNA